MSLTPNLSVEDGDYSELIELEGRMPDFPFINYTPADQHARIHARPFEINRRDYVPATAQRTAVTNLLSYSEDFTNAAWTKNSATAAANIRANPNDGAVTMGRLLEVAANVEHSVSRAYTFLAATPHTLFVHVAPGLGRAWFRLKANDGTTNFTCFFDLVNGAVGTAANCVGEIIALDDGSFLCSITFTPLAAVGSVTLNVASDGATVSYMGDVAKGLYLWGCQLQVGGRVAYVSTTTVSRTALVPLVDDEDPFAFLISESKPKAAGGDVIEVVRLYGRIPRDQYTQDSRYIAKPSYTPGSAYNPYDLVNGALAKGAAVYFPTQATLGNASYSAANGLYTSGDGAVYTSIKTPTAQTPGFATAGTFTLTRGADTTGALNWNDNAATICAALNGLAGVIAAGITFSPYGPTNLLATTTGGFLAVNVTGGLEVDRQVPVTMNAGSLTISGTSAHPQTTVLGSGTHVIYLPAHLTINAHGLDTSKALAVCWGTTSPITNVLPAGYWGSVNANTIWVAPYNDPAKPANLVGTYASTFLLSAESTYQGGTRLVPTRLVEKFYLPGFSPGITTPADIPVPAGLQNPATFLTALLTPLTGYQTYEGDGPKPWQNTTIERVVVTEVNFDLLV